MATHSGGRAKGTFSDSPQGSHRDGFLLFHFHRNETKLAYSLRTLRQPEPHKNFWKGQIDSGGLPKEQFDATPCLHYPGHCSISIKAFHSPRCPPSSRQMEVQWHWFIYRGPNELFLWLLSKRWLRSNYQWRDEVVSPSIADGTILLLNRKEGRCSHQVGSSWPRSWN